MNSYDLSRKFIDFSFENPSKIKPNHYALYFFSIEHCNRLGWKKEFGLPTTMTMEAIGIRSYNTYANTFNDLVNFGFFNLIQKSTNQYSANIIALSNFNKAQDKALDKAFIKHGAKQGESTGESIDSIDKQETINKEQVNNKQTGGDKPPVFFFAKELLNLGFEKPLINDLLKNRKTKKLTNTETALNSFIEEIEKTGRDKNEVLKIIVEKGWGGFKASWEWQGKTDLDPTGRKQQNSIEDFKF